MNKRLRNNKNTRQETTIAIKVAVVKAAASFVYEVPTVKNSLH